MNTSLLLRSDSESSIDAIHITALVRRGLHANRNKTVLSSGDGAWSGGQIEERILQLGRIFEQYGVGSGQRISMTGGNMADHLLAYAALLQLGALPVLKVGVHTNYFDSDDSNKEGLGVTWLSESQATCLALESCFSMLADGVLPEAEPCREAVAETETVALNVGRGPAGGEWQRGSRSHLQLAYTGLFGSFVLNGDRGQTIAVVGHPEPAVFEALFFACFVSGAHVQAVPEQALSDFLNMEDAAKVNTWVVNPLYLPELLAHLPTGDESSEKTVLVGLDVSVSAIPVLPDRADVRLQVLLVSALDGVIAEYNHKYQQWQGFPGVDLAVDTGQGVTRAAGSNGTLLIRSPQISLHRENSQDEKGFYVDGWARLPGRARLKEMGFEWQAQVGLAASPPLVAASADALAAAGGFDVASLIRRSARWRGSQAAIEADGRRASYADLIGKSDRLVQSLVQRYGIVKGDRVAIMGRNSLEFVVVYLAVNTLGAIFIPINFRLKPAEVAYILKDSGAKLLLHNPELSDVISEVQAMEGSQTQCLALDPVNTIAGGPLELVGAVPELVPDEKRPASILYTAGTTGFPKGAIRSNRNVAWFSYLDTASEVRIRREESSLVTTPMFHITGHEPAVVGVLSAGGFTLIQSEFKVDAVLDALITHRIASLFVPPTIGLELLEHVQARQLAAQLRCFRYWSSASAPLPEILLRRAHELLPWVEITNTLGMTEAGSIARHIARPGESLSPNCIGRAVVAADVDIVDEAGNPLPEGQAGEIVVRSPQVISAYWNNPDANQQAFRHAWFHGGDVGEYDATGYIEVKGRLKDMIITGGENVYAAEVENVLLGFPEVKEVAVFGRPDKRWGESVQAAIVLRPECDVTESELIQRTRALIAHYKCPSRIVFFSALPRNPMGKVMKFAISA